MRWYVVGFYSALFSPALVLMFLWRKLRLFQRSKYGIAIAGLASVSYGYLLAALMYKSVLLGPDYSARLFLTVEVNTAATLALSVMAVVRRSPVRTLLTCSTLMISFAWFFVWAINTTV
jgi:hypothetical protein